MIFTIFAALVSDSDPPKTVKSCAKAKTCRPSTSAVAGDHAVARNDLVVHPEVATTVGDQLVDFLEGAEIEEQLDTLAGRELAGLVLLLQARLAAAQLCAALEVCEDVFGFHVPGWRLEAGGDPSATP